MENHHERAAVGFDIHPRIERQQHHQRANVEDEDTVDHLIHRFRNSGLRIARLGGGNADQLQAAKGEHDHRQGHNQFVPAGGEEAAMLPEVIEGGAFAAVAREEQPQAKADHRDNRQHLDQGKPELHLAVEADVNQVGSVDDDKEHGGPDPRRHVRQPVLHIDASRGQLGHAHQHKHYPVVPAGEEAREGTPVFPGKVGERTGDWLLDHHLAQLAHNQEGDNPGDAVAQQHRWPGHLNCRPDAQKQPGADSAAQRDKLNMSVLQTPLQRRPTPRRAICLLLARCD